VAYYIGTQFVVPQTHKAHLQLKKHNYFNFAESKREAEECTGTAIVLSGSPAREGCSPGWTAQSTKHKMNHKPKANPHT
jgi:hypothetical protein